MNTVELIRQGFSDEPDVEAFVHKYEEWESLVLNLRAQLDQTESMLDDQKADPDASLRRARLAADECAYREELRQLRRLVLTAVLYPVRHEAATLSASLANAMRRIELDPTRPTEMVDIADADLVELAAEVTRWRFSRN